MKNLFSHLLVLIILMFRSGFSQAIEANPVNVAIFVFNGVQTIDYTGPYEVFGTGGFNVYTVAEKPGSITSSWGLSVNPKYDFSNHPKAGILVIPGGGVTSYLDNEKIITWIKKNAVEADYVLSVCNGAFFLAKAGILDGLEATTTAGLLMDFKSVAPKTKIVNNQRVVDNGKIITSGGLSAGIEGALHVVSKIQGEAAAQSLALGLEYYWNRSSSFLPATLAKKHLVKPRWFFYPFKGVVTYSSGNENQWKETVIFKSDLSADAIMKKMDEHLITHSHWNQRQSNSDSSNWEFKDENDKKWNGDVTISTNKSNNYIITINVVKQ